VARRQGVAFTLERGTADATLLSFRPELAIKDVRTKLLIECTDGVSGVTKTFNIDEDPTVEPGDRTPRAEVGQTVGVPMISGAQFKLYFGDFSYEMITDKHFTSQAQMEQWARDWFREHRDNFVMGDGKTIGIPELMARQTHRLTGLGRQLDGEYYFARVRHVLNTSEGYEIDFTARKVIP
jgi:hypothetical protein